MTERNEPWLWISPSLLHWLFFWFSVLLVLLSVLEIHFQKADGMDFFNMALGLFTMGMYTNVILSKKSKPSPIKSGPLTKQEDEDAKWASYLVKKE